ncbi:hypothetical protein B0J18DRAFT_487369 [Chaetomium sp. MPI-SDFR-AT-0129]|nr:hypothetical protein B0J18DRAFT_487369 [Chaetomium sp. MPI-SDFR-AT-0129]
MAPKRARDDSSAIDGSSKLKKAKRGFRVGPDNLPDGAWRRKVTKIKKDLITKAKVKKEYAKIKAEHQKQATTTPALDPITTSENDDADAARDQIHPERQAMLDSSSSSRPNPESKPQPTTDNYMNNNTSTSSNKTQLPPPSQHQQQPQQQPEAEAAEDEPPRLHPHPHRRENHQRQPNGYFSKELAAAERAKQAAADRRAEAERREQERQRRIADRDRYRRAMDKAKAPGRDGRPRVGRESKLLLERVRRVMGESS